MSVWRYKLDAPYSYKSPLLAGIFFENEWGYISNGEIEIAKNYAWDGCSPAWRIGPFWLGTPDGRLNQDGRPQAFYASLVHDFLCQFRREIPIRKLITVELFHEMLIKGGFSICRAKVYAKSVDWFGPQRWAEDDSGVKKKITS